MCTFTFVPNTDGSYIFTSNRDESPERNTPNLSQEGQLIFPKEPLAGGTWICLEPSTGKLACLLNGAFEKHKHRPPYRRSRGLLVLDIFNYVNAADFFEYYDLQGIEPFTLIIFEDKRLYEFRWDEQQKHLLELDTRQPHIWSSSPLYPAPIRQLREQWFADWLQQHHPPTRQAMLDFHQTAGKDDPENGLVMRRYNGALCTISITSVFYDSEGGMDVKYWDVSRKGRIDVGTLVD